MVKAKRNTKRKIKPVRYQVQSAFARDTTGDFGWERASKNYKTKEIPRRLLKSYVKADKKQMKKEKRDFRDWRFRVKKIGGRK